MAKVILAELTVYDAVADTETTYYWSDLPRRPFGADDADRPNQAYDPRLIDPANIVIEIFSDYETLDSAVGGGVLVVSNNDGALTSLRGKAFRRIELYWGEDDAPFGDYVPLLKGRAASPSWTIAAKQAGRLSIPVYDKRALLDTMLPPQHYAGTSSAGGEGYEGSEAMADTSIPYALGNLTRAGVPAIWANAPDLVAQVHDGAMEGITGIRHGGGASGLVLDAVYSGGAFDSATPAAGEYAEDRERGLVKFGAQLPGALTFDLKGANEGGYEETAPALMERILTLCGAAPEEIGASFGALAAPEVCGVWLGQEEPAAYAVGDLFRAIGGWCVPDLLGRWQVGRLALPSGAPAFTLRDEDIIDIAIDGAAPTDPVWRVTVTYARNYSVLARSELAGAVLGTDDEARATRPHALAVEDVPATLDAFPEARELFVETALQEEAAARALGTDLLAFFGPRADGSPRQVLKIVTPMTEAKLATPFGAEVHLTYSPDGIDLPGVMLGMQPTAPQRHLMILKVIV